MTRRVSLPGASELFFRTTTAPAMPDAPPSLGSPDGERAARKSAPVQRGNKPAEQQRRGSPRKKHDSKITVYLAGDELLALERARLELRAEHELAVDRGRLVREAIAVMLQDFEDNGEQSVLVRRLHAEDAEAGEEPIG